MSVSCTLTDIKTYSDGLIHALKDNRLTEASNYINSIRNHLDTVSRYIESKK